MILSHMNSKRCFIGILLWSGFFVWGCGSSETVNSTERSHIKGYGVNFQFLMQSNRVNVSADYLSMSKDGSVIELRDNVRLISNRIGMLKATSDQMKISNRGSRLEMTGRVKATFTGIDDKE